MKEKGKHSRVRKRDLANHWAGAPTNAVGTGARLRPKGWSWRQRARGAPAAVSQDGGGHSVLPAEGSRCMSFCRTQRGRLSWLPFCLWRKPEAIDSKVWAQGRS